MRRYGLLLLLIILRISAAKAQYADSLRVVQGVVTDSLTGKSVPFATVSAFAQGKLINGTLTDSLGRFRIENLPNDTYHATFSAVGYRTVQTPIWVLNSEHATVDLGTVTLRQDAQNLKAVTVRGQKPLIENRVDGITFNVESLPSIAGSSASDILRKVPLLSVDANGGLSMRGSSHIRLFIDGKPSEIYGSSVADVLKTIPGESIIKVDVITHPSARYDAEGTDGVVNVITRKLRNNATNGNISGVLGNRSDVVMADMQSKRNKWLVKMDGYYQTYWNQNGSVLTRETNQLRVVQQNETRNTGTFAVGGINVLYSLDSTKTLNAGYRIRYMPNQTSLVSDNFQSEKGMLLPTFQRQIYTPSDVSGNIFTSGYTGTSKDKRKEFSILGTYFVANNDNRYVLSQTDNDVLPYGENFDSHTLNRELILQTDYSQTFTNKLKWETGGKFYGKYIDSDSRFGIYDSQNVTYRNDPLRSNVFTYRSGVYAAYTNLNFQVKNWQFMTGLRYEVTALSATFKEVPLRIPPFQNLMPNVLISKSLDKKSTLKLGYSTKLVRPYFQFLNPTVNNSDSLNVQSGNPYLQPELTRRYQISYSRNDPMLFSDVALFFNNNQNSIESIRTARADGVFYTTWQNVGRNQRLGMSVNLNWKPTPKISLGTTLTVQYVKLESPVMLLRNTGLMRQLVLNYSHKLPRNFSIDFYGFFDGNNLMLQGYRSGWKYYSLTFSKKSANERFNVSLRMDTPLTTYTFIDEEIRTESFRQLTSNRYQNQNIRLTFSYKLGKKEIKGPRVRQAENPD
ncbi:TonB-dependent receptor [Spirosoma sp. BT702]|uniref:TonB-dependent receptor n=1 Tax=Spirosoma profusum TaxID=2771354 RepID=A0A927AQT6_9BACT|nr:outer membrane beta-barrel family protein [Spirosoma profusum]MBD2701173.1 TonB-dependent receptor [Spirosoma profusum]